MELPVHPIQRAWQRLVRYGCSRFLAAYDALDTDVLHQSGDRASRNIKAFSAHLLPNLPHAADAEVILKDPLDLGRQITITLRTV